MLEEKTHISQFDIQPNGCINVRKTTEILKDGQVISSSYWRCALSPNDEKAQEVLNEPYFYDLALKAWENIETN